MNLQSIIYRSILLLGLIPSLFIAQSTDDGWTDPVEVKKLTFDGLEAITESEIRQNIAIVESDCTGLLLTPFCWISKASLFYQKSVLDRKELVRDMLRIRVLYFKHGYRQATVDTTITPLGDDEVEVKFTVVEGPPTRIRNVQVEQTVRMIPERFLNRLLRLREGDPFNLIQLDSSVARIYQVALRRGYADATVDTAITLDSSSLTADILLTIDPKWVARIGDIEIYGNMEVEDSSILRSLTFKPGDVYRSTTIQESQRNLYESNLFRRASIETREGDDSIKSIMVLVQEGGLREARISAGFNTMSFIEVGGRFTNHNWFGKARRVTIQGSLGNLFANQLNGKGIFYNVSKVTVGGDNPKFFKPTYTASIESRRPWFLSPANEIALGVFANRRSTPGIFIDQGYGASATFTRRVATNTPASLNYRFEVTRVDASDVYFCVSYGVCDYATLNAIRLNHRLSPVAFSINTERALGQFASRKTIRGQIDAEAAGPFSFSDFKYGRISGDGALFIPVGRASVLGFHLRAGYVKTLSEDSSEVGRVLHPRKRFYAGGSQSVRGFGEAQLGPRILTIAANTLRADSVGCPVSLAIEQCNPNSASYSTDDFDPRAMGGNSVLEGSVEYRFPLPYGFTGAMFVDAAIVSQNVNSSLPRSRTAVTPGFGVRYVTPVGPIRVDLGINPKTSETLPVITEEVTSSGRILKRLTTDKLYQPASGSGWSKITSRLQLHLSIGEAF